MTIVARNNITVSNVNDGKVGAAGISIVSVDVEYAKNKSNTNQPTSGWTTISPKWEIGSYIWQRVKTTYSVGNPTYSQPHCIETDTVNNITDYISSRGENLVTNGTGLMKNNTNFSRMVFDGTDNYGSSGSFKYTGGSAAIDSDELIPVDPNETYKMSYYIKENPYVGARTYGLVSSFDPDGNLILAAHTMFVANTLTELAQVLKNGDTKIYLNSTSNWVNTGTAGVATHTRKLIVWDYSNSYGYTYPPETYSRRIWSNLWDPGAINHTEKSITLKVPWAGGTIAMGTKVSNGYDGGNYKYISGSNFTNPQEWTNKSGLIGGIDMSGQNINTMFFPGTSAVKVGWLLNRDVSGGTTWLTNITFNKHVASQIDLDNTNKKVNKTVKNITEEYYQSTSTTSQTGGTWTTVAPTWQEGKFIFIRSKITYVDDTTSYTPIVNITGAKGDDGLPGKDGVGIRTTTITYASSTSGTTAPDSGWTSSVPSLVKGQYLWTKTVWTYTDNTSETGYSVTYISKDGIDGDDGLPGKDGVGIKTTTITYASSTSGTTAPSTGWTSAVPTVPAGSYLWTKTVWGYTDNTSETGYSVARMGLKGDPGTPGAPGAPGINGTSGIIVSSVAPDSPQTGQLWQDTSTTPQLIKKWTGSEWVIWELYAQNLKADTLSALSSNLGDVSAGTVKLMADVAVNSTFKKHGIYQSKLGLLSSGPSLSTPSTFSNSQMGVANLNRGELRFIVTDYTEDLKTVQESGISDQNTAFIRFSSYDNGKDVMVISSSGDIVFNGITSQDTPWIPLGKGATYKSMFSRIYISISVSGNGSSYIQFGTLPSAIRPLTDKWLVLAAESNNTNSDRHVMVRASDGAVILWNSVQGAVYNGEVSYTL